MRGNLPPKSTSVADSVRNAAIPSLDTRDERVLRSRLHSLGLRFRLHCRVVPGTKRSVDIVFPTARVAVFVDGCFWHRCPIHYRPPKGNAAWWEDKIGRNVVRDLDTTARLEEVGWHVIRVWSHEPVEEAALRIYAKVRSRARAARK